MVAPERVERLLERDEVAGNEPRALMNQLVKRMLAVCAGLAPVDRPGIIGGFVAINGDVLAGALHRQLLQIRWKSLQILLVRQHRDGLSAEEVVVPDGQEAHEHRQIALKRSGAEMF